MQLVETSKGSHARVGLTISVLALSFADLLIPIHMLEQLKLHNAVPAQLNHEHGSIHRYLDKLILYPFSNSENYPRRRVEEFRSMGMPKPISY